MSSKAAVWPPPVWMKILPMDMMTLDFFGLDIEQQKKKKNSGSLQSSDPTLWMIPGKTVIGESSLKKCLLRMGSLSILNPLLYIRRNALPILSSFCNFTLFPQLTFSVNEIPFAQKKKKKYSPDLRCCELHNLLGQKFKQPIVVGSVNGPEFNLSSGAILVA